MVFSSVTAESMVISRILILYLHICQKCQKRMQCVALHNSLVGKMECGSGSHMEKLRREDQRSKKLVKKSMQEMAGGKDPWR